MSPPENIAVRSFREYLRIPTVHPNPDYESCQKFLKKLAADVGLEFQTYEAVRGKPIVILTLRGTRPDLPSLLLNSHTDVVPVSEDLWRHPPFGAEKDDSGNIYARGAQDMKCVGIQYVEALRILLQRGFKPKRTFHLSFVPDEEIGGHDGMQKWLETEHFKQLNCEFALDEGLPNPGDGYKLFYGERAPWWIKVVTHGPVGHGSMLIENTSTQKLNRIITKFLEFRDAEQQRLSYGRTSDGRTLELGDVTSINLTMLKAGVQFNVIPETAEACFDIRVSPSARIPTLFALFKSWVDAEGGSIEIVQSYDDQTTTSLTDDNPYYSALRAVSQEMGIELSPSIFPASTDGRYMRAKGIQVLGISPMQKTPVLAHGHDEYLNEKVFLDGLQWYCRVFEKFGQLE